MKSLGILAVSLLAVVSGYASAQADVDYKAPRTEYGQPELQGVWNFASNTPFERPVEFGDREFLTPEEIRDGTLARAYRAETREREANLQAARAAAIAAIGGPTPGLDYEEDDGGNGSGGGGGDENGGGGNNDDVDEADRIYIADTIDQGARGENLRTSLITYPTNGRLPAIVEGALHQPGGLGGDIPSQRPVRFSVGGIGTDGPEDRGLSERCIVGFNAGPPLFPSGYNNNLQIIQHKDYVVIMTEMLHDARFIPLDSTAEQLHDDIRLWSGDSRGYWEGETLVVELTNFSFFSLSLPHIGSLLSAHHPADYGNAYEKTLTERFTRVGPDTINYEFTLDDPATFTDRIEALIPITKVDELLYEYACHEGNYAMGNMLRGGRMAEQQAASADERQ